MKFYRCVGPVLAPLRGALINIMFKRHAESDAAPSLLLNAALVMIPHAYGVPRCVRRQDLMGHTGIRPKENKPASACAWCAYGLSRRMLYARGLHVSMHVSMHVVGKHACGQKRARLLSSGATSLTKLLSPPGRRKRRRSSPPAAVLQPGLAYRIAVSLRTRFLRWEPARVASLDAGPAAVYQHVCETPGRMGRAIWLLRACRATPSQPPAVPVPPNPPTHPWPVW